MKRILLICCFLFTTTVGSVYAQSGRPVLASKSTFAAKVTQFDNYVIAGKISDANKTMDDIVVMIKEQVRYGKYKISDAAAINDTAGIRLGQKNINDKWSIYNDMSNYIGNVTANKSIIDLHLSDFMKVMD